MTCDLRQADIAHELDTDPERIVIAGASAGGGLAAGVTLLARDRNGPAILARLLMSPMLDDRNDSPSTQQMWSGETPNCGCLAWGYGYPGCGH